MKLLNISNTKRGSLLLEASVALAIASIVMAALATIIISREVSIQNAIAKKDALFAASIHLNNARLQSIQDPLYISEPSVKAQYVTPCLEEIIATSTWQTHGISHEINFKTTIADTTFAHAVEYDCNKTLFAITSTSTFTLSQVSSEPSGPLDVFGSNIFSQTNIGSSTIKDIDATKNIAYVALAQNNNQIGVIAMTNPTKLQSTASLPGVAGSFPQSASVRYYDKKVYVGTHRTAGHEFHIFDDALHWLGSVELNHNINAISVREPYAYLATSGNTADLIVLNIATSSTIKKGILFDIPGTEDSISSFLIGPTLYIGRKKSIKPSDPNFFEINIASSTYPIISASASFNGDITSIAIQDTIAFLAIKNNSSKISVVDVQTMKLIKDIAIPGTIHSLDLQENNVFVSSDAGVFKITLQ